MSLQALWAWGPSGPGGPSSLEALLAWRPGGPLGKSESCFNPFYFLIFLAYDTFLLKIHTGQTDCPIQFFFLAKMCRNVILGISFVLGIIQPEKCPNFLKISQGKLENLVSSACLKKSILLLIFFVMMFSLNFRILKKRVRDRRIMVRRTDPHMEKRGR